MTGIKDGIIRGIAAPLRVTRTGKWEEITGDEYLNQLILMSLSDCESQNPFHTGLGIDPGILFDTQGVYNTAAIKWLIEETFTQFESDGLAKLLDYTVGAVDQDGHLTVGIRYHSFLNGEDGAIGLRFD